MAHKQDISNREKLILILFTLNGLIWAVLGVLRMIGLQGGLADPISSGLTVGGLMLINGGIMLWFGGKDRFQSKRFYILAAAFLGVNILLTIADEFGALDLITGLIDVLILGLLIRNRSSLVTD